PFDHAFYFFARSFHVISGVQENRKLAPSCRVISRLNDQLPNQMVEAGPQVMKDFTTENTYSGKSFVFPRADVKSVFLTILDRVVLKSEKVCLLGKVSDKRVEIDDLLSGPLNLDANSIKWIRHGRDWKRPNIGQR